MSAMTFAQIIGVINAYLSHKRITFETYTKGRGTVIEFFRFTVTYVFSFCVNVLLLPVLVESMSIDPKIAGLILVIITTITSYLGHSRFSFKKKLPELQ